MSWCATCLFRHFRITATEGWASGRSALSSIQSSMSSSPPSSPLSRPVRRFQTSFSPADFPPGPIPAQAGPPPSAIRRSKRSRSSASFACRHSLIPPIFSIQLSRAIPPSRRRLRSRQVRAGMLMLFGSRSPSLMIASTAQCVKKCWYLYRTSGGIHAPSVARSIAITTPWSPISLLRSAACRRNVPGVPMSPTRSRILDHSSSLLAIVSPFQRSSLVHNRVLHNPVFHSRQFVYADSHVHDAGDGSTDPGPVRQATTKQHLREAGGPNWLQPAQAMGDVTGQVPNAYVRSDPFAVESRCRRLGWALTG